MVVPVAASSTVPPTPTSNFPRPSLQDLRHRRGGCAFPDYLYVAFTAVVAFRATGTMPLTHRAKGLMAI